MKTRKKLIMQKLESQKSNQSGFTLVEMLVVIAVLLLIMSILMPSLARAKEQTRKMVCQSNLRQQGTLMMAYAADNNETYPVAPRMSPYGGLINWRNGKCWARTYEPASQMALYVGGYADDPSLFYCPSARAGIGDQVTQENDWDRPAQTYPQPDVFKYRCYSTNAGYATWTGFGYDIDGNPVRAPYSPRTEEFKLIQKRAAKNAMSRCDTVVLSDIISESLGDNAPSINNHYNDEKPEGGNIQYNDGSVRWVHFEDTEVLLDMPTIEACFRL